jgi:hypothetical protein
MPGWAARPYLQSGQLAAVRVGAEGLFLHFYAARLRHKSYPLYYDCFLGMLRQEMLVVPEVAETPAWSPIRPVRQSILS